MKTNTTHPGEVWVIDDLENNRLLAQAFLERIGWTVRLFDDAEAALHALDESAPEAMLVDIRMPRFHGDLLATIVRATELGRHIRIVGYTAHALPDEVSVLLAGGFDEILIKPVRMAEMARALPRPAVPAA
jgi:CheY-like chemotaxis protein